MLLTSVLPGNHWHFVSSLSERRMDKKDLYWYWRDSTTHTTEVVPAVLSVSCQIFSHQTDLWVSSESSTVKKTASISLPALSISLYYDSSTSACTDTLSDKPVLQLCHSPRRSTRTVFLVAPFAVELNVGHFLVSLSGTCLSGPTPVNRPVLHWYNVSLLSVVLMMIIVLAVKE